MRGYFGVAAAEQPLHDGWLDTGDLGFLIGGELFLSGRAKDLIIRGGANIHPHEIEEAVQRLPEIRPGRLAVFQTGMTAARENEVVCAIETRLADGPERDRLERDVRAAALDGSGVAIQRVAFVAPGGIPRTTSGKVQRRQARERYEAGTL
jgi:acyl-CoA synthetase (AMP-forming)/AMP-acid ligase II